MKKILKKVIFAAERNYYDHRFQQCQLNSRKTWSLINEITSRKKRERAWINSINTEINFTYYHHIRNQNYVLALKMSVCETQIRFTSNMDL